MELKLHLSYLEGIAASSNAFNFAAVPVNGAACELCSGSAAEPVAVDVAPEENLGEGGHEWGPPTATEAKDPSDCVINSTDNTQGHRNHWRHV